MQKPFRETALPLLAAGNSPVPIVPGTKRPALADWQRLCVAPLSSEVIDRFARSPIAYGIGLALGFNGLIAIDIDTDDAAIVAAIGEVLPIGTVAKIGRRGWTGLYLDPTRTIRTRHFAGHVDVLSRGAQTVIPPTPHPTGGAYRWLGALTMLNTPVSALPIIAPDIAERLATALSPWIETTNSPAPAAPRMRPCQLSEHERERQRHYAETILARELAVLASMASDTGRNQTAFRLVCRIGRWAHHGIIPHAMLTADILDACRRNGLVREDGHRAVLATIASGLTTSAGDTLPDLGARHG
jgi:hypothetical protein